MSAASSAVGSMLSFRIEVSALSPRALEARVTYDVRVCGYFRSDFVVVVLRICVGTVSLLFPQWLCNFIFARGRPCTFIS